MLTPDEENKLQYLLAIIANSKELGKTKSGVRPQLGAYEIEWLAEKLKKVNDECSKVSEELYKVNKELADFREHYEG